MLEKISGTKTDSAVKFFLKKITDSFKICIVHNGGVIKYMSKRIKMLVPYIDEAAGKLAWDKGAIFIMTDSGKIKSRGTDKYYKIDPSKEGNLFEYVKDEK